MGYAVQMNILLVYPKYPDTYWSFKHALQFINKKAAVPPLGLLTVSAMLPMQWNRRLIDMNTDEIRISDLLWADYVFLSAMYVQKESVNLVIDLCLKYKVKIVAGGPLFTQEYLNYPRIDHFVLNEAEITLPFFLNDLRETGAPQRIYATDAYADLSLSPVPDYHLLHIRHYANMSLQVTRGCPFACDFCEITSLLGHKVRMKETSQVLAELDALERVKWQGPVSVVDDNFIGNRTVMKHDLLPAITRWMHDHKHPFAFSAQVSINLADDAELLTALVRAGFNSVFIGIETPDEVSLQSCNKVQNERRDLLHSVKTIQQAGMEVSAGFIVGFDTDTPTVFQRQTEFIQQSGIISAMVGLLNAPKQTILYQRLESENRLTTEATGSNTDYSMNFIPAMDSNVLMNGYRSILRNIYTVKPYYKRIRRFFENYRPLVIKPRKLDLIHLIAFFKSIVIIGMLNKGRREYWKFLLWTLFKRRKLFTDAMTYAVYGYHFRTVYGLKKSLF